MDTPSRSDKRVSPWRLLALARPERGALVAGTAALVIASGASLVYPQAIRWLLDEALGRRDVHIIDRTALVMSAVLTVQAVATALRYKLFTSAGERVVARLRAQLYEAIVRQEIAFFDARRTGELTSRLASDTQVVQNAVSVNISMLLRNAATAFGGVALLVWTSPRLAALMLAVVPPVAIGAVLWGRVLRKLSKRVQDALADASHVAEESLGGIRTVRAFGAEPLERRRYDAANDRSLLLAIKRVDVGASFVGIVMLAALGAGSLVLWYGGRLVIAGDLSVGSLTSFLVYTLLVATSVGALSDLWIQLARATGSAERIFEILDRAPAMPLEGGLRPAEARGEVRFDHVRFRYPARPDVEVLGGIDLALSPGETVAIVGASGAGKSTLAALLTRLYDPTEGRVLLDGHDLRDLDPSWLHRVIGVVPQEPTLFSTSIADNVRYGRPDATDAEVESACRSSHAHEFVARQPDGYATLVGERGIALSGGQRQRVAIARALLQDPRVLVLDEATSALDAESEHLVQEALERLAVGRTVLVIAHRLSTVMNADRVVVLDEGRVAETGDHRSLLERGGLYKRLVERQLGRAA
ncbi:MAG: ATP-binding cassette domain-containing protein [Deltaproteobacteria bacterium]|nr:ATP-binding cassette domain-containing protein [Deltaproteobacteria bacterium]